MPGKRVMQSRGAGLRSPDQEEVGCEGPSHADVIDLQDREC
jgi:hypothetical protein